MDFEDNQSLTSSSPPPSHKKRAGRKIFKETRHPIYRGVRRKNESKWVCELREPNKKSRIWLGTFPTPETAAIAHDVAALALRGDNAQLNFPGSVTWLPLPKSSSQKDIQRAAFQAARDFMPVSESSGQKRVSEIELASNHGPGGCASGNSGPEGFVDEEELFNMPVLLDSMAEGMLLTPLAMKKGFNWSDHEVDDDGNEIMALWGS